MKYPRCKYYNFNPNNPYKHECNAPNGWHTFDEGCKGHRSSCPSYEGDTSRMKNICKTHNCKIQEWKEYMFAYLQKGEHDMKIWIVTKEINEYDQSFTIQINKENLI